MNKRDPSMLYLIDAECIHHEKAFLSHFQTLRIDKKMMITIIKKEKW